MNDRHQYSSPAAATTAAQVRQQASAAGARGLATLDEVLSHCAACPRLVAWRTQVAATGRRAYAGQQYWGRPVPGWGDPQAPIVVVGLAPAAHGGNRTGRIFTGDRSGDFLFAALHRVGLARLPTSDHVEDGQELFGVRMVAAVRCAPPQNKPTITERDTCAGWLHAELELLAPTMKVVVALGSFGWSAALRAFNYLGWSMPRPRPVFGHGAHVMLTPGSTCESGVEHAGREPVMLVGSYHPSQQNTFTGKLTQAMLDQVLKVARHQAGLCEDALP